MSKRPDSEHIAVSDQKVKEYNAVAAKVEFDWVLEIDNNGPATRFEILQAIKDI